MATITANLDTLQRKGLLIGQDITLDDDTVITVVDFESDPLTHMFVLEDSNGNTTPVRSDVMGTVTITGVTKPEPKNGGTRQKAKKPKL